VALKFTSEIIDDVLFRAGEPTDGTSDFDTAALDYVNRAYRAIWVGGGEFVKDMQERWLWLKKDPPGTLVLNPVITLGSVVVTQGLNTVTFSSPPAVSVAGRLFKADAHTDIFRVITHTAGSASATLDAVYTGTSGSALQRSRDVTASARSLPDWIWPIDSVIASSKRSTRPPSTSVSGLAPPRNGTCVMSIPAMALSNSPERWCTVPMPDDG